MSSGQRSRGSHETWRNQGRVMQYDEVPRESQRSHPHLEENVSAPGAKLLKDCDLAVSADPLPPPALPLHPPVGPEFYPDEADEPVTSLELKPVRRFIPDSVKNMFKGKNDNPQGNMAFSNTSDRVECSPPASPTPSAKEYLRLEGQASGTSSYRDPYGGSGGSYNSRKEVESMLPRDPYDSLDRHTRTVQSYNDKVQEYNLKYSYMKSWAGLLRILGAIQLLFGAAVFACVCAYIHKDNEWYNMFGYSRPYSHAANSLQGGYYYDGPKTPFVIVVAGLAWVVTIILLVLGMSMYYRTILLDSNWWPLTEFAINIVLFILFLAAAIVYLNDMNRGGLCYYPLFNTPLNSTFCRVEGGQIAAVIFLFATMFLYLISSIVCLKLWRHEAKRRHQNYTEFELRNTEAETSTETQAWQSKEKSVVTNPSHKEQQPVEKKPAVLSGSIPAGHIPKPLIMADYLAKYPTIRTPEERERYKAVFNDQHAEYKELHAEVQATLKKFNEMDAMMSRLPQHAGSQQEYDRIANVFHEYQKKKNDPTFLEKKERCEYLKNKLSHIKQRIQEYDKVMNWNDNC
ncbi:MARVEL domain-containing protein 2b isoform X1 [Hypanus sabinus]|uniref:MARVEL domain-containing protein 2b isoform X1 n=1 Tax=Hypanus sabinus TaxID=79690 RepID=UPI0028C46A9E|nr:MARVEL domain-containing protein 2b isoform X1 [Hypanus sabinus]XP_059825402.1 MARVEL domain-containing protein 2b isoform X1 [Hypanus sabinus]